MFWTSGYREEETEFVFVTLSEINTNVFCFPLFKVK